MVVNVSQLNSTQLRAPPVMRLSTQLVPHHGPRISTQLNSTQLTPMIIRVSHSTQLKLPPLVVHVSHPNSTRLAIHGRPRASTQLNSTHPHDRLCVSIQLNSPRLDSIQLDSSELNLPHDPLCASPQLNSTYPMIICVSQINSTQLNST